jgi:hypothetical protein
MTDPNFPLDLKARGVGVQDIQAGLVKLCYASPSTSWTSRWSAWVHATPSWNFRLTTNSPLAPLPKQTYLNTVLRGTFSLIMGYPLVMSPGEELYVQQSVQAWYRMRLERHSRE